MGTRAHPWIAVVAIATVIAGVVVVSAVVAAEQPTEPAFVVELTESGDANVTLRVTFDLDTDEEAVFRELEADASNRTALYRQRLAGVASQTQNATGREMSVTDAESRTYTDGGTGVLALSVRWNNLAATTDDGVRLRQPFASGFTPPRRFVVIAPEGQEITTATPAPTTVGDDRVVWARGTDLSGFIVETTAQQSTTTDAPTTTTQTQTDLPPTVTETRGPAPLPTVLLVAGLAGLGLAHRRR